MVWFSGSDNSTVPVTFGSDIPLLPWQRKFTIYNTKLAIKPQMLAPIRGFSESANLMVSVELCSDNPCCHGNEKLGILPENLP